MQVHEIGKEIYVFGQTFQIAIENEYYVTLQKDEIEKITVGTTLEQVTYTMHHSLSRSKQYVYVLEIIMAHLLLYCIYLKVIYIYIWST